MKKDRNEIKIGDNVIVDRGSMPHYVGKLVSIYRQGWWEYGEVDIGFGEIKMWDSDVHRLIRI